MNHHIQLSPLAFVFLLSQFAFGVDDKISPEDLRFFESRIRPVLIKKCYSCHSEEAAQKGKLKAKLLLDSKAGIVHGGESGPLINSKNPKDSLLLKALRHETVEMPQDESLPANVIADFESWIAKGTPDPRTKKSIDLRSESQKRGKDYWAFRRLEKPDVPRFESEWCQNDIDRFVLARLHEQKMTPAGKADAHTLVRRLYLNLTGLPPSPDETKSFVEKITGERNGTDSHVVSELASKLLQSTAFGEHWGRLWLDVARFGESEGSNPEEDKIRPNAYKFRDAVIRASYRDMPYDKFVYLQLTGKVRDERFNSEKELAQFVGLGTRLQRNSHPNDKKFHILDDMVSATGSAFLGLTIECARCHDHKIDPVTTEEYYQLTAVFFDQAKVGGKVGVNDIKVFDEPVLLQGGNWQSPLRKVKPGFVKILNRQDQNLSKWTNPQMPREGLADWMTDVEEGAGGLVARVIVNRIWHFYFGKGIVSTPNDFGGLGEKPSHPKLLDWLATELVENEWSLHHIHKLVLTSATFQQASAETWIHRDLENRWLWHYRSRRLSAEAIRDNVLAVSGSLIQKPFGPSISVGTNRQAYQDKPEHWRRSVYLMNSRFQTHPVLKVFDPSTSFKSLGSRQVSTTPVSALFGMNSKFLWLQAKLFAKRVESIADKQDQVKAVYDIALARPPTQTEMKLGVDFLSANTDEKTPALVQYCHAIMNLNEFIYIR